MALRFDKEARDEWLGYKQGAHVPPFQQERSGQPLLEGHEGELELCPACERGEIVGGICNHCHTPYQRPQRSEWVPEQVIPHYDIAEDPGSVEYQQRYPLAKTAEASMPPEGSPMPQKETALPYTPEAYEGMVESLHPAAQYTYQRAVQQGAAPQAAMAAAQEKQGEMMKRTQEGQNVEGVQIPVINTSVHSGFIPDSTIKRISHLL